MLIFFCIVIVGSFLIGIIGLIIDSHLDKKHGVRYDHHGNEIAHNSTGELIFMWWCFCGLAAFVLNEFGLLNN